MAGLFDDIPAATAGAGAPAALPAPADGADISRLPRITVTPGSPQKPELFDDIPSGGGGQFGAPLPEGQNYWSAREGPSPPVAGPGEAAAEGALRGATFNWMDELNALGAAGGLTPEDLDPNNAKADPAKAVTALVRGAYRLATGDPEALAAFQAQASAEREKTHRLKEQQPAASLAGELAGGLAVPVGAAASAPTLGARVVAGARTGAAVGAISGAGEGTNLKDRAIKAATGGVTGTIVGAGVPVAAEGAAKVISAAAKPFTAAANTIRGIRDPEAEAARRVATAIESDFKANGANPPGLNGPEFAQSVQNGGPASIIDLGGEKTRALARSAANTSPEGRAALNSTINDRFESQSDRVSDWLTRRFGPSDTGATREALQDAARKANRPAYAKAYAEGDKPLWSDELQRLVGSPDVVDAMKAAAQKGKSRAIVDGFGGFNSSVQVNPSGVVTFTRGANGQPTYPNLQFWDYVRRELSDAAQREAGTSQGGVLKQLSGKLNEELDRLVPSYQTARSGAAKFFGADDALQAGEKFLTGNMPIGDARRAYAAMSAPEKQLFREGFVQSLTDKVERSSDRRNMLNAVAQSPRAREQLQLALGPQGANEWEAMMRVEGIMDLARKAVQGNSTTARQLAEIGFAGGTFGLAALTSGDITNPSALMTGILMYGAAKGHGKIDQRVAQKVGELLASSDTKALRKGIEIVAASHGRFLDALRNFDQAFARTGAEQAPRLLPAVQGTAASHADQDQQH